MVMTPFLVVASLLLSSTGVSLKISRPFVSRKESFGEFDISRSQFSLFFAKKSGKSPKGLSEDIKEATSWKDDNNLTPVIEPVISESLDIDTRAKLKAEIAAPFYSIRQFVYVTMVIGGLLGTVTTIPQVIKALPESGDSLSTSIVNVGIDIAASALGCALWFFDSKRQSSKIEVFKDKENKLGAKLSTDEILEREKLLAALPVEIQTSEFNETSTRIVSLQDLQAKGKQNVILFAGDKDIVKDAILSARIEGSDLFTSKETMFIPVVLGDENQFDEEASSKGFGNKKGLLSSPYLGKPMQVR